MEFGDDYILCMIIKGCTVQFHLSRSEVVHAGLSIVKENCKWLIYKFVFSFSQFLNLLQEQIEWAVEENADFIIGETFNDFGEAMLALKSIKEFGKGVYRLTKIGDYHASTNSVILWRFICRINRNTQRSQKRPATSNRQALSQNLIEYILSGEYNGN